MGTKESLLALFEAKKGVYFSGEELAEQLSVSRTAVWKAVNALRGEGYEIDAVQNRGYCLSPSTDILSAQGIQKYLGALCGQIALTVLPTAGSTNALVRDLAGQGAPEGTAVLANQQTSGKGRVGRSFFSPADTGLYLSLLLRPDGWSPQQSARLTTMAAVAVCEAIESVAGRPAGIKWVNDIFMDGKKVCGILTEASFGLEDGLLEYAVLGVGINAYPPKDGFPQELSSIAGSVLPGPVSDGKNRLAGAFLNRLMDYYTGDMDRYTDQYRQRSLVAGRDVLILSPKGQVRARALDVDRECRLVVRYEDGREDRLSSGEISVRFSAPEPPTDR